MISKAGILLPDGMETPGDITLDAEGALHGKFSMGAGSRQDVTLYPAAAYSIRRDKASGGIKHPAA